MTFSEIENKFNREVVDAKHNYTQQMTKLLETLGMYNADVVRKSDGARGRFVLQSVGMYKCDVNFAVYKSDCTLSNKYEKTYGHLQSENEIISYLLENFNKG